MNINSVSFYITKPLVNFNSSRIQEQNKSYYQSVQFCAVPKTKKINIEQEKRKLLKFIDENIKANTTIIDVESYMNECMQRAISLIHSRAKRLKQIHFEMEEIVNSKSMNSQQKINAYHAYEKEYYKLLQVPKFNFDLPKVADESLDIALLNKFRFSIENDEFNLNKTFYDYYFDLLNFTTVEEVKGKYPKIKIPQNPLDIICKKLEKTLTRDFYEKLDDLYNKEACDNEYANLFANHFANMFMKIIDEYHLNGEIFIKKIMQSLSEFVLNKYVNIVHEDKFSYIPEQKKKINFANILSENDINLLAIDFNDFVLNVLVEQYVNRENLNMITYSKNGVKIKPSSLKEPEYKFEKINEKIKKIMNQAQLLHLAQRDYEHFNENEIRARLAYFANTPIGENEIVLNKIIEFDSCAFTEEDRKKVIDFLNILDNANDGFYDDKKVESLIFQYKIQPVGTILLNEQEKLRNFDRIKQEQKEIFALNSLKAKFNDAIDFLYKKNLCSLANTCSSYSPKSLDADEVANANFIIDMINNEKNLYKIETSILRWNTYNLYKKDSSYEELINKAKQVMNTDSPIDIGQYIINYEIVENYPESKQFVKYSDFLEKIMQKADNKEQAIKYLIKYNQFEELSEREKQCIENYTKIFDIKNNNEKFLLKHLLETVYVNTNSEAYLKLNEKDIVTTIFNSKAKSKIINEYQFPIYIDILEDFENSIGSLAKNKNDNGIKQIGTNNKKMKYKMEVKLKNYPHRLLSSKNDYNFDIFSIEGYH